MSRTFRVKHAEAIVAKNDYHKVAGVYSKYDIIHRSGFGHPFEQVWREPTKVERREYWLLLHSDKSHTPFEGMKKWEKNIEHKRHRAKHERLISEFLKGKTDDVLPEKMPTYPSNYW